MLPELKRKHTRLKSSYDFLKVKLIEENDQKLNITPAPEKWSVLQIMTHLHLSESLTLQYLEKKMQAENLPVTGIREAIRSLSLRLAFSLPLKFEAPEVVRVNIPDQVNTKALFDKYDSTRTDLEEFLSDFPENKLNLAIFRHPRIGYINIIQTLDFLQVHFQHHEKQINSILKK
jgi:hypothetical protein